MDCIVYDSEVTMQTLAETKDKQSGTPDDKNKSFINNNSYSHKYL